MLDKAKKTIALYNELTAQISSPEVLNNHLKLADLSKQQSDLESLYKKCQEYVNKKDAYNDNLQLIEEDDELSAMAAEENNVLLKDIESLEADLKILFIPKDPNDKKNIILEIRAGTGGSEACLFANDLYRMYIRYAEIKKWKIELVNMSENEGGGIKEAILSMKGGSVYGELKFESGVHRVQRVPDTESSGRLHTSAATVAVLPEAESVDIEINDADIKAVVVATPVATHFDFAIKCLEAGKHILVEKPIATTVDEVQQIAKLAKEKGLVAMVGHTFLFNSAVRYVKEFIDTGELGDIRYIYSQRVNLGRIRNDVDALWNLAPHDVSIIQYWLSDPEPVSVNRRGMDFVQNGIDDVVFMNIEYPDNVMANIHVSWLDPHKIRKMTVVGSKKMAVYDDIAENKIAIYDKGIDRFRLDGSLGSFDTFDQFQLIQRAGDVVIPRIEYSEPLRAECKHFVECITENKQPTTDGDNGLRVVEVLEAASRSLALGGEKIELS